MIPRYVDYEQLIEQFCITIKSLITSCGSPSLDNVLLEQAGRGFQFWVINGSVEEMLNNLHNHPGR